MRTPPPILKKQRLTAIPNNGMAVIFVETTTDCVGGAEKALAMKRTKKLLLV